MGRAVVDSMDEALAREASFGNVSENFDEINEEPNEEGTHDCLERLIITLNLNDVGKAKIEEEFAVVDRALDLITKRFIRLRNSYIVKVRQEPILWPHGLKFKDSFCRPTCPDSSVERFGAFDETRHSTTSNSSSSFDSRTTSVVDGLVTDSRPRRWRDTKREPNAVHEVVEGRSFVELFERSVQNIGAFPTPKGLLFGEPSSRGKIEPYIDAIREESASRKGKVEIQAEKENEKQPLEAMGKREAPKSAEFAKFEGSGRRRSRPCRWKDKRRGNSEAIEEETLSNVQLGCFRPNRRFSSFPRRLERDKSKVSGPKPPRYKRRLANVDYETIYDRLDDEEGPWKLDDPREASKGSSKDLGTSLKREIILDSRVTSRGRNEVDASRSKLLADFSDYENPLLTDEDSRRGNEVDRSIEDEFDRINDVLKELSSEHAFLLEQSYTKFDKKKMKDFRGEGKDDVERKNWSQKSVVVLASCDPVPVFSMRQRENNCRWETARNGDFQANSPAGGEEKPTNEIGHSIAPLSQDRTSIKDSTPNDEASLLRLLVFSCPKTRVEYSRNDNSTPFLSKMQITSTTVAPLKESDRSEMPMITLYPKSLPKVSQSVDENKSDRVNVEFPRNDNSTPFLSQTQRTSTTVAPLVAADCPELPIFTQHPKIDLGPTESYNSLEHSVDRPKEEETARYSSSKNGGEVKDASCRLDTATTTLRTFTSLDIPWRSNIDGIEAIVPTRNGIVKFTRKTEKKFEKIARASKENCPFTKRIETINGFATPRMEIDRTRSTVAMYPASSKEPLLDPRNSSTVTSTRENSKGVTATINPISPLFREQSKIASKTRGGSRLSKSLESRVGTTREGTLINRHRLPFDSSTEGRVPPSDSNDPAIVQVSKERKNEEKRRSDYVDEERSRERESSSYQEDRLSSRLRFPANEEKRRQKRESNRQTAPPLFEDEGSGTKSYARSSDRLPLNDVKHSKFGGSVHRVGGRRLLSSIEGTGSDIANEGRRNVGSEGRTDPCFGIKPTTMKLPSFETTTKVPDVTIIADPVVFGAYEGPTSLRYSAGEDKSNERYRVDENRPNLASKRNALAIVNFMKKLGDIVVAKDKSYDDADSMNAEEYDYDDSVIVVLEGRPPTMKSPQEKFETPRLSIVTSSQGRLETSPLPAMKTVEAKSGLKYGGEKSSTYESTDFLLSKPNQTFSPPESLKSLKPLPFANTFAGEWANLSTKFPTSYSDGFFRSTDKTTFSMTAPSATTIERTPEKSFLFDDGKRSRLHADSPVRRTKVSSSPSREIILDDGKERFSYPMDRDASSYGASMNANNDMQRSPRMDSKDDATKSEPLETGGSSDVLEANGREKSDLDSDDSRKALADIRDRRSQFRRKIGKTDEHMDTGILQEARLGDSDLLQRAVESVLAEKSDASIFRNDRVDRGYAGMENFRTKKKQLDQSASLDAKRERRHPKRKKSHRPIHQGKSWRRGHPRVKRKRSRARRSKSAAGYDERRSISRHGRHLSNIGDDKSKNDDNDEESFVESEEVVEEARDATSREHGKKFAVDWPGSGRSETSV